MRLPFCVLLTLLFFVPTCAVRAANGGKRSFALKQADVKAILQRLAGLEWVAFGNLSAWDAYRKVNQIPLLRDRAEPGLSRERELGQLGYILFFQVDNFESMGLPRNEASVAGFGGGDGFEIYFVYGDFDARKFLTPLPRAKNVAENALGLVELPASANRLPGTSSRSSSEGEEFLAGALDERMLFLVQRKDVASCSKWFEKQSKGKETDFLDLVSFVEPEDAVVSFRLETVGSRNPEPEFQDVPGLTAIQTCGIWISARMTLIAPTFDSAREIARLKRTEFLEDERKMDGCLPDPAACVSGIPNGRRFRIEVDGKLVRASVTPQFVMHLALDGWD